jgi:CHAT domain-containing protein
MKIGCGQVEEGIDDLRDSIDLIEARRVLNTDDPLVRARYFSSRQWVYAALVDVLARQKRFAEAFAIAERMKARALDDAFATDLGRFTLTDAETAQQRALNQRIVELNRKIMTSKSDAPRQELRHARIDLEMFNAGIAIRHSKDAFTPEEVVALPRGTVVEYSVLSDSVVTFVIRDGHVTGTVAPRASIERDAARFAASIHKRDLDYKAKARALYDELVRPIAAQLHGDMTIVPDSFLWNVPFDALITPSHKFLIEEHTLAYAPSVMMLDAASRHRRSSSASHELLAVGDPSIANVTRKKAAVYRDLSLGALPDAAREAREVATLYGRNSMVLTHATARESAVKELAPGYRILHLATHGFVDDESPLYSALVLASAPSDRDDGLLEMREVRDLDLHADLIVLSACDTARGTVYPGEGVIGLSWAFLTSGCPTTVVSQWNVESHSTSTLMIDFHKRLLAGDSAESALRRAKLALMHDKRYSHPLYWAPFIVVGDGVARIR